jgi:hypothetical protein
MHFIQIVLEYPTISGIFEAEEGILRAHFWLVPVNRFRAFPLSISVSERDLYTFFWLCRVNVLLNYYCLWLEIF